MNVNRFGDGTVKLRMSRIDNLSPLLKKTLKKIEISSLIRGNFIGVKYFLGSIGGSIPLEDAEVSSRLMQYGAMNLWAEISFKLEEDVYYGR